MKSQEAVIRAIEERAIPFSKPDDLDMLISRVKNASVVMLGEASHGTAEFYQWRRVLSEILIRDHGFNFIAVEGDWPDSQTLHQYIREGSRNGPRDAREVLENFHRWPTWMWANEEVVKLAEALRGTGAGFYGLDVYSLYESIDAVIRFVAKANPLLARRVRERYSCFEPFHQEGVAYAKSLLQFPEGCEKEVLLNLQDLLRMRTGNTEQAGDLFDAQQNARVVLNAERYYRAMLRGDVSSWNLRDEHMLETLERLLKQYGDGAKAIVWAHNTHIGDYRATDMAASGYVNIGGLARERFGNDRVALVGFGTYRGEVTAGHAWDAPEETMRMPSGRKGSYEECFHEAALRLEKPSLCVIFDDESREGPLAETRGHRAIGVVYDPLHEGRSNYVPTSLANRYDAFLYIDQTTALRPLKSTFRHGDVPDTWPMGQ